MSWTMMPVVTTVLPMPRLVVAMHAATTGTVPSNVVFSQSARGETGVPQNNAGLGIDIGLTLAGFTRRFGADTDALARTVVENLGLSGIAGIDALARSFFARTALPEGFDPSHGQDEDFHARQAGARVLQAVEWLALTPHADGAIKAVQSSFVAALDAGVQYAQNPLNTASMAFAHGRGAAVRDVLDAWVVLTGNAPDHATFNDHVNFVLTQGREAWAAAVGRFVQGAFTGADGATRLVDTVLNHMALRHVSGLEQAARDFFGTDLSQAGSKVLAAAQWLRDNGLQSADPVMRVAYQRYTADVDEAIDHSSSAASAVVRRVVDLTQPLPSVQPDTTPVVWGQDSRGLPTLTIDTVADLMSLTQAQRDSVWVLAIRDNGDALGEVFSTWAGQTIRGLDNIFIEQQSQRITLTDIMGMTGMGGQIHIVGSQERGIAMHVADNLPVLHVNIGAQGRAPATIDINGFEVAARNLMREMTLVFDIREGNTLNVSGLPSNVLTIASQGGGTLNVVLDRTHDQGALLFQNTGGTSIDARNHVFEPHQAFMSFAVVHHAREIKTSRTDGIVFEAVDTVVHNPDWWLPGETRAANTTIWLGGGGGGVRSYMGNDVFIMQGHQSEPTFIGFTPVAHDHVEMRMVNPVTMEHALQVVGNSGADQLRIMVRADPEFGHPNPFNPDTLATSLVTVAANGGVRSTQAGDLTRFQRIVADDTVLEAGTNVVVFGKESGITSAQELQAALQEGGRFTLRMGQAQGAAQADGFLIAMYHFQSSDAFTGATWTSSRLALIDFATQTAGSLSTHGSTVADQFDALVDTAAYLHPIGVPQFEWTAANIAFI